MAMTYRKSYYDKGDGDDYINIPLDKAPSSTSSSSPTLRALPKHDPKDFELDVAAGKVPYFEGCLPIEEMAARGEDALRYGPLKPVGLRDPRTGKTPYAVVQLRNEDADGKSLNLVGFQTRLTWPAQKEAFAKLPGLANAEWLRLGVMHRNTFIDAPRLLDAQLQLRARPGLYFAGQITGAEGYVEAAACGAMTGIAAAYAANGNVAPAIPAEYWRSSGGRAQENDGVARLSTGQRHVDVVSRRCRGSRSAKNVSAARPSPPARSIASTHSPRPWP